MKKVRWALAYALTFFMIFTGIPYAGPVTVKAKKQVKAKTITLNKTIYTLKKGKKVKLKATILPKKSTQKKVVWTTNKKKVAIVSKSGVVKAKKNGTATITAKIKGTKKKTTCKIIVGTPVSSVKLSETSKQMEIGGSFTLKANVMPTKASVKTVTYESSNKEIAEVTQTGVVKAKSAGNVTITAISKDGTNKKATCKIQVIKKEESTTQKPSTTPTIQEPAPKQDIKTTGISLNKDKITFYLNSAPEQLKATVKPDNATNKGVIWSSKDEKVATVSDNGVVRPLKEGTTEVTVAAADQSGAKATCTVEVISGIEVTSAQQLREVLNDPGTYDLIHFSTEEKGEIAIPESENKNKFTDTVLEIDAPNATITNHVKFKEVKILDISKDTYIEHADNTLIILAKDSHVIVKEDATIELQINDEVKRFLIDNGGKITNAVINTTGKVTFEGNSDQTSIPVTVEKNATIYTANRLDITAKDKVILTLKAGSEGTSVNTEDEKNIPEVKGLGTITVRIINSGNVDEKTIVADQTNEDVGAVTISSVTGTISDSEGKGLNDVTVSLVAYSKDFKIADFSRSDAIKTVKTDADGVYKITSVKAGNYYLIFQKDGYYEGIQTCTLNNSTAEITMAPCTLTSKSAEVEKGSVSGKIIDSVTGKAVSGVTVRIREGQGNVTGEQVKKETKTDSEGNYKFTELTPGIYTIQVLDLRSDKQEYISTSFNVYIESGKESVNNGTGLSPIIDDEQVRFVLRWGNKESGAPEDLDSHMIGPNASGSGQFHTFYMDKSYIDDESEDTLADLDLDDTTWEGPETTTIYKKSAGTYYFYVHNYTDKDDKVSSTLATSQASVQVYSGSRLVQTFYVPNKEGTLWSVCGYDSLTGTITPINKMSYESEPEDVGDDVIYGDLRITDIKKNDFVKKATISGSKIKMRVTSDDIKEHLGEIIPEIKASGVNYRIEEDDDGDYTIIISDGKGLERTYRIYYSIDYGKKYITSFERNDNLLDYSIEDDDNYVYLYMKYTDLSKEEVLKTINPIMEGSEVKYKIQYNETSERYEMILTDTDGSTRTYIIMAYVDTRDIYLKNITSNSEKVTSIRIDQEDENIKIYGKANDLNEIKDTLNYEFSDDVSEHEFDIDEDGDGRLTLRSAYGGKIVYTIYYYIDYGTLAIDSITSNDQSKIDNDSISVNYDKINIYAEDITNDIEEVFKKYLSIKFKSDTVTGELRKSENSDEYEYVITDSETKKTRSYNIRYNVNYSSSYGVTGIADPGNVLTDKDICYDADIYLYGTPETLEDALKQISFEYGENVISGEVVTDDGQPYLVLKCKDNITRTYWIYYNLSDDDE